jgi:hypothetical protein
MAEALKPVLGFRRYKVYDNTTMRDFYFLLRPLLNWPEQWDIPASS